MNNYKHSLLVWSNLAWFAPAGLAVYRENYLLVIPAICVMLLSMWFHWRPAKASEQCDTIFSLGFIAFSPYLLTTSADPLSAWTAGVMVTVLAGGVWWRARQHDRSGDTKLYHHWHALWHMLAANVTNTIYLYYLEYV